MSLISMILSEGEMPASLCLVLPFPFPGLWFWLTFVRVNYKALLCYINKIYSQLSHLKKYEKKKIYITNAIKKKEIWKKEIN